MSNIILKIVLGIISFLIIKEYIGITLDRRREHQKILDGLALGGAIFLEINSGIPILNFLINYMFFLFVCIVGYKGEVKSKIIVSFSLIVIWAIGEVITGCLTMIAHVYFVSPEVQGPIISKLIVMLLTQIVKKIYSNYKYKGEYCQYSKYWWLLILFPLSSIIIVYFIFGLVVGQNNASMVVGAMIVSCLFLPVNIGIFKIYNLFIHEFELEQQNVAYRENIRMFSREMKIREESMAAQSFLHDIKKHLLALQGIAKQHRYHEITNYLEQIRINYLGENTLVNSGNFIVDTLINAKYKVVKEQNIEFRSKIIVPDEMRIDEADICILLGNALDNAIEAISKVERKILEVSIVYKVGKLTIGIKNTYSGEVYKNHKDDFVSTKNDRENHGIGMKLVKKVIEKYDGFLDTQYDDLFFTFIAQLNERNS